jgi:site-specific DNA recombinase
MREQVISQKEFDTLIEKAAAEAGYSEGFGVRYCDLAKSHWWASYVRQSSEEQAKNNRLPDYLLTCAREARKLGGIVPREYIFYDTVTGEHLQRPDMIRLRQLMAARRITGCIFPLLERLSRETIHIGIFEFEAEYVRVKVHYGDAPSGTDPMSQMVRMAIASAAKFVKLANRENNRGGNIGRAVSGNVPAGKTSYGYTYCAEYQELGHGKRKLIRAWWEVNALDADGNPVWGSEAWVVVQIFYWIGHEGRSTYWVANELNRLGIKPRYAEVWSPALVGFIVKNHAYTGEHAYNKGWYVPNPTHPLGDITAEIKRTIRCPKPKDEWVYFEVPALVSDNLWQKANQNIRERGKGRGKAGKTIQALFRARVFCPKCGGILRLHRDSSCAWLTYYVCRTRGCGMRFIRVSWLDELGWDEVVRLLQSPALVDAQLKQVERHDDTIQRRIRLEQFRKRQAEAKITRIQEDQLNETSLFTRQEAAGKIEELRKVIEKADGEIARLQSIAQLEKQSEETVEATRKTLERLRDTNLKTASFEEKGELVAKLGIKIYPSEDLTHIRIFCGLNVTEPQKVSCHKTSIASPKL